MLDHSQGSDNQGLAEHVFKSENLIEVFTGMLRKLSEESSLFTRKLSANELPSHELCSMIGSLACQKERIDRFVNLHRKANLTNK